MNKKSFSKYFLLFIFAITCIFIGYEYPSIIQNSKKYVKFSLKKVGLIDTFIVEKKDLASIKKEQKIGLEDEISNIIGNSFVLKIEKFLNFDGRTAGLFIDDNNYNNELDVSVYLQEGVSIKNNLVKELDLPVDFFLDKNGGVKSVLQIGKNNFALISNKKNINCFHSSIINLSNSKKIFSTECIPDYENIDFNGLGGAYIEQGENIFMSIGSPEWNSEKIRELAQESSSIYGKILKFKKNSFLKEQILNSDYEIYTLGHKNPQGMVLNGNNILSVEHGPQGGDEINLIQKNKNYGWPIVSLGTRYDNGKSYKKKLSNMQEPIYSFIPSIAPSSINNCPKNLTQYYYEYSCLMVLSLRAMSLFIVLTDKEKTKVVSIEQFKIDQRLRHFALNQKNRLYQKDSSFYISADGYGIYKMSFINLR